MSLETFFETAWNDHGDRPEEVAARLAGALDQVKDPADVPPFAQLVVHLYGAHLHRHADGVALLDAIAQLPVVAGVPPGADTANAAKAVATLRRSRATLRYSAGEGSALDGLADEDRCIAVAGAAAVFAGGNQFAEALAAYAAALAHDAHGLPAGSPALRALAVGGNNLAAALEEKPDRDARETAGMVAAAEAGLKYWRLAGTWLQEERAYHRLASSQLQAGLHAVAADSARACLEVCARNGAPPFEVFFGHAALAAAQQAAGDANGFAAARADALQCYEQIPGDERQWCAAALRALHG